MVYRKPHLDCDKNDCQSYSAYIRVQKRWVKAGEYNSECKSFTPTKDVVTYDQIKKMAFRKLLKERLPYWEKMLGIR